MSRLTVLGIGISAVSMDQAVERIADWVANRGRAVVAVAAVHSVVDAQDDPVVKTAMNRADLCVPDGMPLVWLLRRAGYHHVTRVFGPDLMLAVCERLAVRGARMFYYGGGEGVADELAREMERRFPGLKTAGTWTPPFRRLTSVEEDNVARKIDEAAPDILWVGLSSPKQEAWMAKFRPRLSVPVMLGVGAAFDYNTGRIARAPRWMQRCALEWLYRLIQEPRRLWRRYARNNPLFVWLLIKESAINYSNTSSRP